MIYCFVHLIFILDYENDVRQKKQLEVIFIWFKTGCKAEPEQLATSMTHWLRTALTMYSAVMVLKFCKGQSLDEEAWNLYIEVDQQQLRTILIPNLSSYNYMRSCKELNIKHSMITRHLEVSLTLCNNKPFHDQVWPSMKNGFYMTTSDNQLSGWTAGKIKTVLKLELLHQIIVVFSCSGLCPSEPLQLSYSHQNCYI